MIDSSEAASPDSRDGGLVIGFVILLLLALGIVVLAFPLGTYTVYFGNISNTTSGVVGYLWLGLYAIPINVPFLVWFGVVITIYVLMFAFALTQGRGVAQAVTEALHSGVGALFSNKALLIVMSIGFFGFTVFVVDSIITGLGYVINYPFSGVDPLMLFLGVSTAPLTEEIGFRVLIIGTAAVIVSLGRPRKEVLRALWRPSAAYEGAGGRSSAFYVVLAAGTISAVIFGLVHIPGYGLAKFPEALYAGVFLVFLYTKYGFHVAVFAHWGIDYLSIAFQYYLQGQVETLALLYLFDLFGGVCFFVVAYLGLARFGRKGLEGSAVGGSSNLAVEGGAEGKA